MEGKRLISSLRLRNLLSFGSDGLEVELQPLNVLIGPNTSGKSNFIQAIRVLQSAPTTFPEPITQGGGTNEWLWKGRDPFPVAQIEASVEYFEPIYDFIAGEREPARQHMPLQYSLSFTLSGLRLRIESEHVRKYAKLGGGLSFSSLYRFENGEAVLGPPHYGSVDFLEMRESRLDKAQVDSEKPFLSRLRDPLRYPEITYLGDRFGGIKVYENWNVGRKAAIRSLQGTDLPVDFLLEDGSNLALVLHELLQFATGPRQEILKRLREIYTDAAEIQTKVYGGSIQVFIQQDGLRAPVSIQRLSDGTVRYLCLLAVLCHPNPPPLICIEEPELGLHPDVLPIIAELLVEASQRTQLVVTTHSDILVSALSEVPDAILVCERDKGGTRLRRLEPDRLKEWLEKYTLGELWHMGEIGGN